MYGCCVALLDERNVKALLWAGIPQVLSNVRPQFSTCRCEVGQNGRVYVRFGLTEVFGWGIDNETRAKSHRVWLISSFAGPVCQPKAV